MTAGESWHRAWLPYQGFSWMDRPGSTPPLERCSGRGCSIRLAWPCWNAWVHPPRSARRGRAAGSRPSWLAGQVVVEPDDHPQLDDRLVLAVDGPQCVGQASRGLRPR